MIYELSRKAQRQIEDIIRYTDANFGLLHLQPRLSGEE